MKTDKMCRGLCSAPSSGFKQVGGGGGVHVPQPLPEGSQSSRLPLKGGLCIRVFPWVGNGMKKASTMTCGPRQVNSPEPLPESPHLIQV